MRIPVAAAAALLLTAAPALATEVRELVTLPYSVDQVWQRIAPFCSVADWHPAVESCQLRNQGNKEERVIAIKGGGTIEERLLSSSGKTHRVKYRILAAPLPVKDYVATMSVSPAGQNARLVWKATFTPSGASEAEARKAISGIFTSGFDGLKQKLAAK